MFYPIFLDLTLYDFADNKFVYAKIWIDGVAMQGSPFLVPSVGDGRYFYTDESLFYSDTSKEVSILYEVFNDLERTVRSSNHAPARESIRVTNNQNVIDKLNTFIPVGVTGT